MNGSRTQPARSAGERATTLRRLTYLMLFRVALLTILLGATVLLNLGSPDDLASPSSLLLFGLIAFTYLLSLIYAPLLPRVRNPARFGGAQIAADLAVTTLLVAASGAADSAFAALYFLTVIGAGMLRYRRGALATAAASALLYATIAALAAHGALPRVPGELLPAARMGGRELARHLVVFDLLLIAVALLAANLAEQLRTAGERVARQHSEILDLAQLNEDIIRSLTSGLVTVDEAGRIVSFNPAAAEITAIPREEALGRPLRELVPSLAPYLPSAARRQSRATIRIDVNAARRDGEPLPLGVSVLPLLASDGRAIGQIVNFQDLRGLRQLELAMKRAERLAALGQMAAGIAHEVRNPLASISGSVELLRDSVRRDEETGRLIDIVVREVDRLSALITEFLLFARPPAPERIPADLAELVRETVVVFQRDPSLAGDSVGIDVVADEALPVAVDPAQIRQVLWNLLKNAMEASPRQGRIRITCRRSARGAPAQSPLTAGAPADGGGGDRAEIAITDEGPGIPPEDLERIFEPFYTTKDHGTGLGLAIVHRIVTDHEGALDVESDGHRGTTMRLWLPLLGSKPAAASEG